MKTSWRAVVPCERCLQSFPCADRAELPYRLDRSISWRKNAMATIGPDTGPRGSTWRALVPASDIGLSIQLGKIPKRTSLRGKPRSLGVIQTSADWLTVAYRHAFSRPRAGDTAALLLGETEALSPARLPSPMADGRSSTRVVTQLRQSRAKRGLRRHLFVSRSACRRPKQARSSQQWRHSCTIPGQNRGCVTTASPQAPPRPCSEGDVPSIRGDTASPIPRKTSAPSPMASLYEAALSRPDPAGGPPKNFLSGPCSFRHSPLINSRSADRCRFVSLQVTRGDHDAPHFPKPTRFRSLPEPARFRRTCH